MLISLKLTLLLQASLILFFFGKDEKIPYAARQILFILANGGCLFCAYGLINENIYLIKGGIFIFILHAFVDGHFIISRYQLIKSSKLKDKSDAKK